MADDTSAKRQEAPAGPAVEPTVGAEGDPPQGSMSQDVAPPGNVVADAGPAGDVLAALDLPRLVADHADVLFRYAFRLTGSTADAEDLTQQTFLIAHQKLSQLRDAASARSWLFTVLRHAYLKAEIKSRRLPLASSTWDNGIWDIETIPDEVVDNFAIDRELLQKALDELPDPYKLVVLSYYFEDLSYREIAERFELPVGTVMSRLSRAKNQLRSRLLEPECAPATDFHPANPSAGDSHPRGGL